MDIRWDRYSLIINGQRQMVRSGAMHYFRLPGHSMWKDRLGKLKAAGYNTVDLYINWAFHSQQPGQVDFTGLRDIRALLQLTRELGLWVIARPGPYINAELSGGGLPLWLLADPHVTPRNRNAHGEFVWCERYMQAVRDWWGQIIPILNESDNLLMLQIENEYATSGMEPDYMQALATLSRELGVTVPLMHNDMYAAGLYEDVVDLYTFDHYPVTHFNDSDSWHAHPEVFSVIDSIEESLRPFCAQRPLMVTELQAGWFAGWTGADYRTICNTLGREHIGLITKSLLGQGLTAFNHYMAIGGTNWGSLGSTDVLTSYDFAAPINEAGQPTERLFEAKALNQLLQSFDLTCTERVPFDGLSAFGLTLADPDGLFYAFRENIVSQLPDLFPHSKGEGTKGGWLFLRNLSPDCKTVQLQHALLEGPVEGPVEVTVPAFQLALLPVNVRLCSGATLLYSSTEPVYQTPLQLWLKADRPVSIAVCPENSTDVLTLKRDPLTAAQTETTMLGTLTVTLLGSEAADQFWPPDSHFSGFVTLPEDGDDAVPVVPQLAPWRLGDAAPELHRGGSGAGSFKQVLDCIGHDAHYGRADFDALRVYEGCGWYQAFVPCDSPEDRVLTLNARHFWAVYWNGELLGQGQHWCNTPDEEGPRPASFVIKADQIRHSQPNSPNFDQRANHLLIWVDSLGHPKGFHDDANVPQGLLALLLNGQDIRNQLSYSHGVSHGPESSPPEKSPMLYAQTRFNPVSTSHPLMLDLEGLCCDFRPERVNIVLNNQLIGRTWSPDSARLPSQTRFYLPEGLLNRHSENSLALLLIRHCNPFRGQDIAISGDHAALKLYE